MFEIKEINSKLKKKQLMFDVVQISTFYDSV